MSSTGIFNPFKAPVQDAPKLIDHLDDLDDAPQQSCETRLDSDTHVLILRGVGAIQDVPAKLGLVFRDICTKAVWREELERWGVSFGHLLDIPQACLETPYGMLGIRAAVADGRALDELEVYRNICIALNALPIRALLQKHDVKIVARRS